MKKILMTLTLAMAAMIAIPTSVNAQDTKPEQKTECCKDKKDCNKDCKVCPKEDGKACAQKDGKACAQKDGKACVKKEGKACCKEGSVCSKKAGKGRFKDGKNFNGHDRKMKAPKDLRKARGAGENPMFKGITLSEEQKEKMNALREKNMAAEKNAKANMKAKSKEEMMKLRADFDKEVEKILDKNQLKQYQANKAEMEARRAEKKNK